MTQNVWRFRCPTCGEEHEDLPDIGHKYPDPYFAIPESERDQRVKWTPDWCIIDAEHFLVRGVIQIPVHDYHSPFGFGVWVSQDKSKFELYQANAEPSSIEPSYGWLCTRISYFETNTYDLKTRAHFSKEHRPLIELEPTDHPLAVDQRNGISLAKASEIVHHYMRPKQPE